MTPLWKEAVKRLIDGALVVFLATCATDAANKLFEVKEEKNDE